MKIRILHHRYHWGGKIRLGTKADLLHSLQLEEIQEMNAPVVNAKFFDGAVIVQILRPGTVKTFQEYTDTVFMPYISSQLVTGMCTLKTA